MPIEYRLISSNAFFKKRAEERRMVFKTLEDIDSVCNEYVDLFLGKYGVNSVTATTLGSLREEAQIIGLEFGLLSDQETPECFGLEIGALTAEIHQDLPRYEFKGARLLYITLGPIRTLKEEH